MSRQCRGLLDTKEEGDGGAVACGEETMRKELRLKDGEPLCDWCERIADYYDTHMLNSKTFRDILREVSKLSYIKGSNAVTEILNKHRQ